MKFSLLESTLWLLGFIGHIALLLILILRRRLKGFPSLTAYVISRIVGTVALYLIYKYGTKHMYFIVYWVDQFGGDPFIVWIIWDIFRDVLNPLGMWGRNQPRALWLFVGLAIVSSAALCVGIGRPGLKGFDLWQGREDVFTALVMSALLAAVSFFASINGLPPRPHGTAVAYGVFTWTYSSLIVGCIHTIWGWDRLLSLDHGVKVLYLAVIGYWCVIFWSSERRPPPLPPEALAYMKALHEQIMADLGSLHPESTVESVRREIAPQ